MGNSWTGINPTVFEEYELRMLKHSGLSVPDEITVRNATKSYNESIVIAPLQEGTFQLVEAPLSWHNGGLVCSRLDLASSNWPSCTQSSIRISRLPIKAQDISISTKTRTSQDLLRFPHIQILYAVEQSGTPARIKSRAIISWIHAIPFGPKGFHQCIENKIFNCLYIRTMELGDRSKQVMVMMHGYGGSGIMFYKIMKPLAEHFHIFIVDIIGMGGSSRPAFTIKDSSEADTYLIQWFEAWRVKMDITGFVLAGHSFGGYVSGLYACKYHQHVKKLLMLSPAGVTSYPEDYDYYAEIADRIQKQKRKVPKRWQVRCLLGCVGKCWGCCSPFSIDKGIRGVVLPSFLIQCLRSLVAKEGQGCNRPGLSLYALQIINNIRNSYVIKLPANNKRASFGPKGVPSFLYNLKKF